MLKINIREFPQSFVGFVKRLLISHWRSLLLLFIGIYLPLQIFQQLAVEVLRSQGGFPWDVSILMAIHGTAQAKLDVFAVVLTKFGSWRVALPIVILLAVVLFVRKRWRSLTYLLTATSGSAIINITAKILLHRTRPQLWESLTPQHDYAFPSGHAMTSMTLIATLVILTWSSSVSWLILIFGSVFVVGIAWTRLYLGVHFPSDILAGWMVSLAWAIGVSMLIKPHLNTASVLNDEPPLDETSLLPQESELLN